MLLSSLNDLDDHGQPGDWCFTDGDMYLIVRLHAGEMDGIAALPLRVDPDNRGGQHPIWAWDGNHDEPTLTPSIMHHSEPPWHGYLTKGKLVPA